MASVVIIGAGLTGISTAYHLEQNGFFDYSIFEKESEIGGLCRSANQDGFTFDYTGHLLHASDAYFYSLLKKIVGLDALNVIDRRSYIYSHNTYTDYPFQINLHGLPADVIVECITGFINRTSNPNPRSFAQWVHAHFGAGLAKHFFFPYQEKIFAYDLKQLTASWTSRFVPPTSLEQMLYGSLSKQKEKKIGYNARFLYPKKGGIASWINQFATQLNQSITIDHCVKKIDTRTKTVTFSSGHNEPYEILISTLPLKTMLSLLTEKSSGSLKNAARNLECNQVINFNIGVNYPNLSDKHWIYFPEKKYPFYRLGFWHNFSVEMAPPGMSSLYGEFAHMHKSKEWIDQTVKQSIEKVKKLFNIPSSSIVTQKIMHIPHAYVIYDQWREKNLPKLLHRLREDNIYSIGRYGAWKYASMQEAVLDGKEIAQTIYNHFAQKIKPIVHSPSNQKSVI